MEPLVDEGLRDVQAVRALPLLLRGAEHELVHRRPLVGDVVALAHEGEEVIRREDRVPAGLHEALLAEGSDIRVSAREHPEVPDERADPADALRMLDRGLAPVRTAAVTDDAGDRKERREVVRGPGVPAAGIESSAIFSSGNTGDGERRCRLK